MYGMKWVRFVLSAAIVAALAAVFYMMRPAPGAVSADPAPGLKTRAAQIEKAIEMAEHP